MMKQACIFHVDNVRVAVIDENIVGIAVVVDASSHLEPPPVGLGSSSKGFMDARKNYFPAILEAVASIENSAHLACLCVDSGVRGQRVGEILLKNVIRECRGRGVAAITLDVLEENPVAIRLYRNYGFETVSCGPGYSFGVEAPLCLRMMLNLGKPQAK